MRMRVFQRQFIVVFAHGRFKSRESGAVWTMENVSMTPLRRADVSDELKPRLKLVTAP